MLSRIIASLAALCFTTAISAQVVDLSAASQLRTIAVTGNGRVYVTPDEAILTVGVSEDSRDLKEAKGDVDEIGKAILAAVRKLGIEEKDIQTDNLQIRVAMEDSSFKSGSRGQRSYVVERNYRLTLRDSGRVQDVYDAVAAAGATNVYGPIYQTSELRKHREQARTLALKAAQEKAQAMAGVLGETIGQVRSIREQTAMPFLPAFANAQVQMMEQRGGVAEESDAATPMGQIAITADVEVVFDLSAR